MRIDNQDIIRAAQQLRDEANEPLNVRPWNRHHGRFRVPGWLVAIPAAGFVGFVLGIWSKSTSQTDAPLTALVDTVYIKVHDPQPASDSIVPAAPAVSAPQSAPQSATVSQPRKAAEPAAEVKPKARPTVGRSVADDQIRYDLLVKN